MIFKRLNNSGETLAETIIALSILAITITIASTVIMNSMRNLSNAKQRVIAVSIAREGIEAVRGIRDSNWLLYSDRRRQCWNHDPGTAAAAPCDPANPTPIEPGYYVVYKHTDKSWRLIFADEDRAADGSDADGIPDNDLALDRIKLSLVDVDLGTDSDGHESEDDADSDPKNDDTDMYNHKDASVTNSYGTDVQSTPFSRYIVIEYMENQPTGDSAITPSG